MQQPEGLYTTLALLQKGNACEERYNYLVAKLGGIRKFGKHTPLPFATILEHNGIKDIMWLLSNRSAIPQEQHPTVNSISRLFAVDSAKRVLRLYKPNKALRQALTTARRYALGKASEKELTKALYVAEKRRDAHIYSSDEKVYWTLQTIANACREGDIDTERIVWDSDNAIEGWYPNSNLQAKALRAENLWRSRWLTKYITNVQNVFTKA